MSGDRYVVLGLASVGSPWFRDVARWATAAMLPVEFVKTVSVEEVRARLGSGRPFSALLVDDGVGGLDRDLVEEARQVACAVVVVDHGRAPRRWEELGVAATVAAGFDRGDLVDVLDRVAAPVGRAEPSAVPVPGPTPSASWRGRLVAVTGGGGTGRSTLGIGLAQGLAADPRLTGVVCLADLALHADQGMLHDARDVVPGVLELADAHRTGFPSTEQVRAMTWEVTQRGYSLLLGVRRHRDWTALRPRAFEAALDGLRRTFRVVVADVDADVEGEDACGSIDVEERNLMARTVLGRAEAVVVVGRPGMKGLHTLVRVVRDLIDHGVAPQGLVPLVNTAPRSPRARAELTAAFGSLLGDASAGVPSPVFVPERKRLDDALRDGTRLPEGFAGALARPVQGLLDRVLDAPEPPRSRPEPVVVAPGSLGRWADQDGGP